MTKKTTLRERCQAILDTINRDRMLRQHSAAETLEAFVVAETGRKAGEPKLDKALPLCLYFGTEQDREEFIALFREIKPDLITRKMP